jgi:hypothetical protein
MNIKKQTLLLASLCALAAIVSASPKDDVSRLLTASKPATVTFSDGSHTWKEMTESVSKLDGKAIIVKSKFLTIDTDGASKEIRACDPTSQVGTALLDLRGKPTDANAIPYFVIPNKSYRQLGLQKGDLAAVISGDTLTFAIAADVGPEKQFGEGSVQLHRQLGHETVGKNPRNPKCAANESLSSEVFIVVFPHSNSRWLSKEDIDSKGQALWKALLAF